MPGQASSLELDQSPARLGEFLSGVIRAPLDLCGAEVYLEVVAVRTRFGSSTLRPAPGTDPDRVTTRNLWRRIVLLDGAAFERGPEHVAIPFSVLLPADGKATSVVAEDKNFLKSRADLKKKVSTAPFGLGKIVAGDSAEVVDLGRRPASLTIGDVTFGGVKDLVNWRVRLGVLPAGGKITGLNYAESFEIPVVRGSSAEPPGPYPRAMPEFAIENFAGRSELQIERLADGAVCHFPAPFPGAFVFGPLLFAAGLTVFASNPVLKAVDAIKWGWIVLGGFAALFAVGWMFQPKRIKVRPSQIRIERVGGFHRTIPRMEIADVVDAPSLTDPVTFGVEVRTRSGKSYLAIPSIVGNIHEARWLAMELKRIISG